MNFSKIAVYSLVLFFFSCEETATTEEAVPTVDERISTAFSKFEDKNYSSALAEFEKLVIDADTVPEAKSFAYLGIGYCQLKTANGSSVQLTSAFNAFKNSYQTDNQNMHAVAALSFMNEGYAEDYSASISFGNILLSNAPAYVFPHDQSIDHNDIRLHVAMSHFELMDFTKSYDMIRSINANFNLSSSDAAFNQALSAEIERLVQVHN